jgi:PAS domain S-box-containing protein
MKNVSTTKAEKFPHPVPLDGYANDPSGDSCKATEQLQTEIVERKLVELELRKSEDRYREIFDESPASIWVEDWSEVKVMVDQIIASGVTDLRHYFEDHVDELKRIYDAAPIIDVSRSSLELYGYPGKQELIDDTTADIVHPDELKAFGETVIAFVDGRASYAAEMRDETVDNRELVVLFRAVLPAAYRDSWERVLSSIEDITDLKESQRALRESEVRYREIFDDAPGALWVEDWSWVKLMIDRLSAEGVDDWRTYFANHRDCVIEAYDLAEVLQASKANLELYSATNM